MNNSVTLDEVIKRLPFTPQAIPEEEPAREERLQEISRAFLKGAELYVDACVQRSAAGKNVTPANRKSGTAKLKEAAEYFRKSAELGGVQPLMETAVDMNDQSFSTLVLVALLGPEGYIQLTKEN